MTLRLTGVLNATIEAPTIQHHTNVLGWAHQFVCTNVTHVTGISSGVAYDRHGNERAQGAGQNVTGNELRIRWSGNTCNVYIRQM